MQIKKKNQNEVFTSISSLVSYCPLCNNSFSPRVASIIKEEGQIQLLYVTCNKCHSAIVMLLIQGEVGVSSVGLVTDLTESDVMRFRDTELVSCNDVVNVYRFLENRCTIF